MIFKFNKFSFLVLLSFLYASYVISANERNVVAATYVARDVASSDIDSQRQATSPDADKISLRQLCMQLGNNDSAVEDVSASLKQGSNSQDVLKHVQASFQNKTPEWLVDASLRNAPRILKGIYNYLSSRSPDVIVPSFHRFILVGAPGTGKTTLAYALAHRLGYQVVFVPAASLLGHYCNETAVNMQRCFQDVFADNTKKVVIIDELHKLFEHHKEERSDHSQTAAAFWLILDTLEKQYPNIVVMGTANEVSKLPPEIKSRFYGKMIMMPLPNKKQKVQGFKDIINNDCSMLLDKSVDDAFIAAMISQCKGGSLRDIQLLIDAAKMYRYACTTKVTGSRILLTRRHFQQALNKLTKESKVTQESLLDKVYPSLKKWSLVISVVANVMSIARMLQDGSLITIFKMNDTTSASKCY